MTVSETGGDKQSRATSAILTRLRELRVDETRRLALTLRSDPLYAALTSDQCGELAEQLRTNGVAPPPCDVVRLATAAARFRQRAQPRDPAMPPTPRNGWGLTSTLTPLGWSDLERSTPIAPLENESGGAFFLSATAAVGGWSGEPMIQAARVVEHGITGRSVTASVHPTDHRLLRDFGNLSSRHHPRGEGRLPL